MATLYSFGRGTNGHVVALGGGFMIWFSYATPIAFRASMGSKVVVRQNAWGTTTGRHLNEIDPGSGKDRLPGDEFEMKLDKALGELGGL